MFLSLNIFQIKKTSYRKIKAWKVDPHDESWMTK